MLADVDLLLGIADMYVPAMEDALVRAWDEQRKSIHVDDLGAALSRSATAQINWKPELGALHAEIAQVGGDIAKKTALTLLPRVETKVTKTERFADWIDMGFDLRFMAAEDFISSYLPVLIVNINATTRETIRQIVLKGFQMGKHPYQMAEEIRDLVGLTPAQLRAYQAFAANLAKGKLSAKGQADALDAYRRRALKQRARNIARTETIRAANAGQMRLWEAAEANGLLGLGARRVWISTPESPRTCNFCADMDGEKALLKGMFPGGVAQPPAHPSCRCTMGLDFD
jgi:SPP1 gp7 family putative phage head morphogenesis protein